MKQKISITLQYDLAIGKVNLNEIVYRLKEVRDPLMLRILEEILKSYDDLIGTFPRYLGCWTEQRAHSPLLAAGSFNIQIEGVQIS